MYVLYMHVQVEVKNSILFKQLFLHKVYPAYIPSCRSQLNPPVGTLHGISHQSQHLQRLAPLKPQEEEAKAPDHSKINQKKPRISLTENCRSKFSVLTKSKIRSSKIPTQVPSPKSSNESPLEKCW